MSVLFFCLVLLFESIEINIHQSINDIRRYCIPIRLTIMYTHRDCDEMTNLFLICLALFHEDSHANTIGNSKYVHLSSCVETTNISNKLFLDRIRTKEATMVS